jgi:hypothetical protein
MGTAPMKKRMQGVLWGAALSVLVATTASAQTIGSADIIDGSIQAIDIAPETITTGRIKNETIQAIDIAPESITTGRILNRTIKAIDIATESITTAEIKNESIHAIDLAPETITTGRIKNETIQAIDIAPESITTGRILNRTIKAIDIATESITTAEIKNGTIAGVDMADGAVTAAKLGLARTTYIEDSGNDTANCTALLAALDGLAGPAVVVLGPGTFACGTSPVVLPAGVSLVGSGENVTTVSGNVPTVSGFVRLADDTALKDLTVSNDAMGGFVSYAIIIGVDSVNVRRWRLSNVTASALNSTDFDLAIIAFNGDCDGGVMHNVTAIASGGGDSDSYGIDIQCSLGSVVGTNIKASGGSAGLIKMGASSLTVKNSALIGSQAVNRTGGTLRVISSELDGTVAGTVICIGDYDETGAALADGTNGSGGCV